MFPIPTLHNNFFFFRPILRQKILADFSNFSPKFFGPKRAGFIYKKIFAFMICSNVVFTLNYSSNLFF